MWSGDEDFDQFIHEESCDLNESRFLAKVVRYFLLGLPRNMETMPQGL